MCKLLEKIPLSVFRHVTYNGDDIRDAADAMYGERDFSGARWRYIHESAIDDILISELESDEYALGCFNADFIASHTDLSVEIVAALQSVEKFDAIGKYIIDGDYLTGPHGMAQGYVDADGYGHHFAHYDFETHELAGGWYAFQTN